MTVIAKTAKRVRIGEALVEEGIITEAALATVLAEQKGTGKRLGEMLVELGLVPPKSFWRHWAIAWECAIAFFAGAWPIHLCWEPSARMKLATSRPFRCSRSTIS